VMPIDRMFSRTCGYVRYVNMCVYSVPVTKLRSQIALCQSRPYLLLLTVHIMCISTAYHISSVNVFCEQACLTDTMISFKVL